jgi:hypothetical protein
MRLTFLIAAAILFGLAAYAKLLDMGQGSSSTAAYGPLQPPPTFHVAHAAAE